MQKNGSGKSKAAYLLAAAFFGLAAAMPLFLLPGDNLIVSNGPFSFHCKFASIFSMPYRLDGCLVSVSSLEELSAARSLCDQVVFREYIRVFAYSLSFTAASAVSFLWARSANPHRFQDACFGGSADGNDSTLHSDESVREPDVEGA